jgi:hypothetical protein
MASARFREPCDSWPDRCSCDGYIGRFAEMLADEGRDWSREDLQAIEDMVFVSLCCLSVRCPDHVIRMWAAAQLVDPFWDAQKERSIME